ncbi:hypothetical protein [Salibacterium aidingense]
MAAATGISATAVGSILVATAPPIPESSHRFYFITKAIEEEWKCLV